MYLNIILTLIFINLGLIVLASFTGRKYEMKEHEKAVAYNRQTNDTVLKLHVDMLEELKVANDISREELYKLERRKL